MTIRFGLVKEVVVMEYSHYDEVPSHLQTKIIAAYKAERAGVEVEEV